MHSRTRHNPSTGQTRLVNRATVSFIHRAEPIDLNKVNRTSEGFLKLNAVPARTGDYEYLAWEVSELFPLANFNDVLIGHITEAEMKKALDSFKGAIVTNDHPWPFVGIENIRDVQVGHMGDSVKLENGLVKQAAYITNSSTIVEIETGKQELSIGYIANLTKNDNPSQGDPHFFIEDIQINHVAVVAEGRGGEDVRLNHSKTGSSDASPLFFGSWRVCNQKPLANKEKPMPKVMIHGVSFEVEQQVADALAAEQGKQNAELDDLKTQVANEKSARETVEAERDALQAKNDELKTHSTPEALQQAIDDELGFAEKVKQVNSNYDHKIGCDRVQVMRDELQNAHPDEDLGDKSDAYIEARFDILLNSKSSQPGAGPVEKAVQHSSSTTGDANDKLKQAHARRHEQLNKRFGG